MDFLAVEQIWAVVMFFFGSIILNICSKWERKDQAILKEAKSYGRRNSDIVKPRTLRGTLMTLFCAVLFLGGMFLFLLHIYLCIPLCLIAFTLSSRKSFSQLLDLLLLLSHSSF